MTVAVIRLESTSLLFVSWFFQHLFTLSIMEADVAGGHSAVAAGDAHKPRKSRLVSSSAVAEGVWGKGLSGTPEPKVAIGIQGRGPSPPNWVPWAPEDDMHDFISKYQGFKFQELHQHLCFRSYQISRIAPAKEATVLAAAPRPTRAPALRPTRAAAPHGSSAVAGVATTSAVEGGAARKRSKNKSCNQGGSNASAVAEERAMSDVGNNCGDGPEVDEEDLHTSAVADDDESSDLAHRTSRVTRSREPHASLWCFYCRKADHDTCNCRSLEKVWEDSPLSWDEFLQRPDLWFERHEEPFIEAITCALEMNDDSRPDAKVKAKPARAKPSRRSPNPVVSLMVAKPKRLPTKPAAVAASTSIPRKVAMLDTGADGSERAAATTAAVAGRTTFREKQPAAGAASAMQIEVKTEEAEEDQTISDRGTGGSDTKKKRKADDDGEHSRSKKRSMNSTASSAVAEGALPDAETVPTADLKRRTKGDIKFTGHGNINREFILRVSRSRNHRARYRGIYKLLIRGRGRGTHGT